ncbi:MAG: choice-of-anchor Q domain-containing protein, partial [Candidatus Binatia bacterium]
MRSDSQGQQIISALYQFWKNSAWGIALVITLLGAFLSTSAQAATFRVNSPSDVVDANPGNGVCETAAGNGICTLRAAIQETNVLVGPNQIILPPNTYLLTIVDTLIIDAQIIRDSLTITGGGAATTIIDGNKTLRPNREVLRIDSGATVSISGVTIRNGRGGGIRNTGTLTLTNITVSGNSGDFGGGIRNFGTLTLTNSTVSGNGADSSGGGIRNSGTLTLTNSTVSGNSGGLGGGIFNADTLTLTNITVSGNSGGFGGGIFNEGTLTLTNSTVSGNSADDDGGGIYNNFGTVSAFNSTITDNRADADIDFTGTGGGVFNGATFNFQNTILAGNFISRLGFPVDILIPSDCAGTINSNRNNLMSSLDSCTVNGSAPTVASPLLGPLQNNGGPTQTHALLAGSPAIDAGSPGGCQDQFGALVVKDQRGFRRTVDGNRDGTARCDIGAVEFGSGHGVTFYSDVDFDGDGRNDIGVYRDGAWFILRSSDGGVTATGWGGLPQDIPVAGDYDGDGRTDVAVYRDGSWLIIRSSDQGLTSRGWGGLSGDVPVPGDYDGDGKTDVAVYRNGSWFI